VEQGLSSPGCHRVALEAGHVVYLYDGRPCRPEDRGSCEGDGAEPGFDYRCEQVGLMGTQTDHGRVRYRGTLQDPNELALAVGITLPFAFAFLDRRRSGSRWLLAAVAVAAIGLCVFFTKSRGGQLVFLSVLAVYFVQRFGIWKGLAMGVVLALPLLLFGGRDTAEGDASTMERLECWWVGLHLLVASPVFGVGFGQFTEHHYLTAHNSFVLTAAELGLPGLLLWTSVVYTALKIPWVALRSGLPPVARSWSLAVLAATTGLAVGSFFLSYAYKDVFWIFVGLSGVLYAAIRAHDPGFRVAFRLRDLAVVGAADAVILLALAVYTGSRMGW
jgi:O-antigen ligase